MKRNHLASWGHQFASVYYLPYVFCRLFNRQSWRLVRNILYFKIAGKMMLLLTIIQAILVAPAMAEGLTAFDKERFLIRSRVAFVLPDTDGSTSLGGRPDADNDVVPELDFTYFFTKHIAMELILATSSHDLRAEGTIAGDLDLGDARLLPPTLLLQYHFTTSRQFSPYIGVGVNYTVSFDEESGNDTNSLRIDNSLGPALQVGLDYWFNDHWGINLDIKKIWIEVDASINGGAITGDVELNPLVIGTGVSYRF